jgi:hypothetical protein
MLRKNLLELVQEKGTSSLIQMTHKCTTELEVVDIYSRYQQSMLNELAYNIPQSKLSDTEYSRKLIRQEELINEINYSIKEFEFFIQYFLKTLNTNE